VSERSAGDVIEKPIRVLRFARSRETVNLLSDSAGFVFVPCEDSRFQRSNTIGFVDC
jgi:hypothetical protein